MRKTIVEMAAEIIQSQCSRNGMTSDEITSSLHNTFKTLQSLHSTEKQGVKITDQTGGIDISPEKSIQKNKIICLECGHEFKMLSPKHLKSHNLTGREYREKHGFKSRQPLCAKSLSDRRSKSAKQRGLPENLQKAIDAKRVKKTTGSKNATSAKKTTGRKKVTVAKKTVVKKRKAKGEKVVGSLTGKLDS
jgi:predicted transcriptional regulator